MITIQEESEKAYTTKDVSDYLNIGTSTLRKWCISLEENGYMFSRVEHNKRLFIERDLIALRQLKTLIQEEHFSLTNASKVIISRHIGKASESRTPGVLQNHSDNTRSLPVLIEALTEQIEQQNETMKKYESYIENQHEFNQTLMNRLEKRDKYIEERIEERDKRLLETLKSKQEEKKKGFFSQIFKKQKYRERDGHDRLL